MGGEGGSGHCPSRQSAASTQAGGEVLVPVGAPQIELLGDQVPPCGQLGERQGLTEPTGFRYTSTKTL